MSRRPINRLLLVLANPENPQDKRGSLLKELAQNYRDHSIQAGVEVDFLDLYREGYNPVHYPHRRDTQTIEYQIRLQKADKVAFFHPVWWGSVPGILKGFLDKVLSVDFTGQSYPSTPKILAGKSASVFALGVDPQWKITYFYNNHLEVFWSRLVFDRVGLSGSLTYFGNYEQVSKSQINRWFRQVQRLAKKQNTRNNLFDLV